MLKDLCKISFKGFVLIDYFSRTIQERFERYFQAHGGRKRWIDVLQSINQGINDTVHSSIDMAPSDVNRENARELFDYLKKKREKQGRKKTTKFEVGDIVRIPINADMKRKFKKGATANWSKELYQIERIDFGAKVPMFKLLGPQGKLIPRRFYEQELNLVVPFKEIL